MIFSAQQLLSDNQAITATAASTNYIDLGATGTPHGANGPLSRDIGKGEPVSIEAIVTEQFDNLTSLNIGIEVDDNTSFSSPTVVASFDIALADLLVGKNLPFESLPNGVDQRYLRLNYTVTGTDPAAGKIYAGISGGRQTNG